MTSVFISVVGQEDNIGDSILRRGLVATLQATGADLHVHVGSNSPGYLSGLSLNGTETLYTSRGRWFVSMAMQNPMRLGAIVLNAGERQYTSGDSFLGTKQGSYLALMHLRGARLIQSGVGIRKVDVAPLERPPAALRHFDVVTWRDRRSRDLIGTGSVSPDWAFSVSAAKPEMTAPGMIGRRYLALSLRGDRPAPSEHWLSAVRRVSKALDLEPIVVTQVKRDLDRGRTIAEMLGAGAQAAPWVSDRHSEQEHFVREIYRKSAGVVSDRLHALIVGATEGAVPIGFSPGPVEKLIRTLEPVGLAGNAITAGADDPSESMIALIRDSQGLRYAVEGARRDLLLLSSEIENSVLHRSAPVDA